MVGKIKRKEKLELTFFCCFSHAGSSNPSRSHSSSGSMYPSPYASMSFILRPVNVLIRVLSLFSIIVQFFSTARSLAKERLKKNERKNKQTNETCHVGTTGIAATKNNNGNNNESGDIMRIHENGIEKFDFYF